MPFSTYMSQGSLERLRTTGLGLRRYELSLKHRAVAEKMALDKENVDMSQAWLQLGAFPLATPATTESNIIIH